MTDPEKKILRVNGTLLNYIRENSLREHPALERIRTENAAHPCFKMFITPEQGQLLSLLFSLIRPEKSFEVGVFMGYSALACALASPATTIYAIDRNIEWTGRAKKYWAEAGVADRIHLLLGEGAEHLQRLIDEGHAGTFGVGFIDADKKSYDTYYELSLKLLREGGLLIIDNVLWRGTVADPGNSDPATEDIRRFNRKLHLDTRVHLSMLPVGDGMTLALKL